MRISDWSSDVCSSDLILLKFFDDLVRCVRRDHNAVPHRHMNILDAGFFYCRYIGQGVHAFSARYRQWAELARLDVRQLNRRKTGNLCFAADQADRRGRLAFVRNVSQERGEGKECISKVR